MRERILSEREEEEEEAAQLRKKKGIADQRSSENGLNAETSRKRQRRIDKLKVLRIKVVNSKVGYFIFAQRAFNKCLKLKKNVKLFGFFFVF